MNRQGKFTLWTCFLIFASFGLTIAAGVTSGDRLSLPSTLLFAGWLALLLAFNNVVRRIVAARREHQIRENERARMTGGPR